MPCRLPEAASDIKVWGLVMNDAFHPLLGNEHLYIVPNSNNPPTVKAGTSLYVYDTNTYLTPLSPATGNNVYPVNTNITYLEPTVIFESADRTSSWGAGGGLVNEPTKSNSTLYYMYTTGAEDTDSTSRGKGIYGVSTTAPAWDDVKKEWIISGVGRAICRFYVDSGGAVLPGSLLHYTSDLVAELYTTSAAAPSITGLDIIKDGGAWDVKMHLAINIGANNVLQYVNNDTTAANYLSDNDRYSQVLGTVAQPLIWQGATVNGAIRGCQKIQYMAGRYTAVGAVGAGIIPNTALDFYITDISTLALRTNITRLDWAVSGGAWLAFSDIRIYRGR